MTFPDNGLQLGHISETAQADPDDPFWVDIPVHHLQGSQVFLFPPVVLDQGIKMKTQGKALGLAPAGRHQSFSDARCSLLFSGG